jgi:hypothetical protein
LVAFEFTGVIMDTPAPAIERPGSHRLAQNLAQLVDDA